MILNVKSIIQYALTTPTQTTARISWLCWHQEAQTVQRSSPRCHRKISRNAAFTETEAEVKEPKCLDLVRDNIEHCFENQRPEGRARVRHPGSLKVRLIYQTKGEGLHGLYGRSLLPAVW